GIHQRQDAGQKLMHAFLLIQIVNHGRVAAGEQLEALFAARVRKAAAIENESAAVSRFVFGPAAVKGETENLNGEILSVGGQVLKFLRTQHVVEGVHQRGQSDRQGDVVQQPAQVLQRVGHTLQKMGFTLIEAAKSVGSQRLHDTDINVRIVVLHEHVAVQLEVAGKLDEIMVEQLLAQLRRQVGFSVIQERGNVILQRAFAASLVVEEKWLAVAQHDIAGLEISIEKVIVRGAQQELGQAAEIVFQRLLVEGDAGEAE